MKQLSLSVLLSFITSISQLQAEEDYYNFDFDIFGPASFIENCPLHIQNIRPPDTCASEGGVFLAKRKKGPHFAVDLELATADFSVMAVAAGKVRIAEKWPNMGNVVFVDHQDGRYSVYAHLASFSVKKGDAINAGKTIGKVGYTGNSDCLEEKGLPPHLHFAVFRSIRSDEAAFPKAKPITTWKQEGFAMKDIHLDHIGVLDPTPRLQTLGCIYIP